MIILNPEFHRNLWLKFSPFRLAAMPVFLIGYLYLMGLWNGGLDAGLFHATMPICFVILGIFGTYEAAHALSSEIKGNTWDFQKMSAIGPWQLVFGKLFGATSYAWYFGLPLLVVMALSYPEDAFGRNTPPVWVFLVASVLSAVFGHASALLTSLTSIHNERMRVIVPLLIGMMVAQWAFQVIIGFEWITSNGRAQWYGIELSQTSFDLYSVLFVLFWVVIGLQRLIRLELQYKNAPLVWMAFVATAAVYVAGLYPQGKDPIFAQFNKGMPYLIAFTVIVGFVYVKMLESARDIMPYKRCLAAWRGKDWAQLYMDVPRWAVTLCFALPLLIILPFLFPAEDGKVHFSVFNLGFGMLLFTLRDGLVLHALLLGQKMRFVSFKVLFYYFLVYFFGVSMTLGDVFDFDSAFWKNILYGGGLAVFLPTGVGGFFNSCGPVILQCGAAGWFLHYRLKRFAKG
ncbi:MAG: hypothetical protein ACTHPO_10145 [Alphaproteobacteria bacterium]